MLEWDLLFRRASVWEWGFGLIVKFAFMTPGRIDLEFRWTSFLVFCFFEFRLEIKQISRPNQPPNKTNPDPARPRRGDIYAENWYKKGGTGRWRGGMRSPAARGVESSVFALECQQVKVGDNAVWCCQTEFLPPNFTSSPRPLSRLQSPPSSLPYLPLLTLIHCSRAPSVQSTTHTHTHTHLHTQK